MKKLLTLALIIISVGAQAQPQFILQGKVEYEKKTNMHAFMGEGFWAEQMRGKMPQFRTTYYDLVFDSGKSVYKAGREIADDKYKNYWGSTSTDDVKFTNYTTGQITQLKNVFENRYLLQDSLLNIEWRITAETRTIAGFECRKAVGKFMDSLYVTAFFTDQILSSGGPESFAGLPGLILGLGFPRLHTTWFATKLELKQVTPAELVAPTKGKKATRADIFKQVKTAVKDWGEESQKIWIEAII
jgi:GLPGLI family protein